jgi:hypothetical protein
MDAFSYLSVLISIVIGLAITQILQGYRTLLIARHRVRFYGPSLIWAGVLLLISAQSWWAMFGMREHVQWTFLEFALVLLQTILTYMLAALLIPDVGVEERVDLRAHYLEQASWFFGFGVALLIVSVLKDLALTGSWPKPLNLGFHAVFVTLWTIAAGTRYEPYHRVLAWLMTVAIAAYVWLLFARL